MGFKNFSDIDNRNAVRCRVLGWGLPATMLEAATDANAMARPQN